MSKRLALVLLVLVGCSAEAELIVQVLDEEACAAHCVDRLEVTALGQVQTLECGRSISLGRAEAGTPHPITIRSIGDQPLTFTGTLEATEGRATRVELELSSAAAPTIDLIVPDRSTLYGQTPIRITGSGFGTTPSTSAGVALDGEDLRVLSWDDDEIVVESSRTGSVQVRQCGVSSNVVALEAKELTYRTHELGFTDCPSAVLAGANAKGMIAADRFLAAFKCGSPCERTKIAQIEGATGEIIQQFDPFRGCPLDLAIHTPGTGYVIIERQDGFRGRIIQVEQVGTSSLAETHYRVGSNYLRLAIPSRMFAVIVGAGFFPNVWNNLRGTPIRFDDTIRRADDTHQQFFVGRDKTGRAVLAEVGTSTIVRSIEVRCGIPRRIARGSPNPNYVVVVCDEGVERIDIAAERSLGIQSFPSVVQGIREAATTRDGSIVVVHTGNDFLVFAHIQDGWSTVQELAARPGRVELIRAPQNDRFYLSGVQPGTIDSVDLNPP